MNNAGNSPILEITKAKLLEMIDDIIMNAENDIESLRAEHYISKIDAANMASEIHGKIAGYKTMRALIVNPRTVITIK